MEEKEQKSFHNFNFINVQRLLVIYPILVMFFVFFLIGGINYFTFHEYFKKEKESVKAEFFNNLKNTTKQRVITAKNVLEKIYNIEINNEKEKLKDILKILIEGKKANIKNIIIKISHYPLKIDSEKYIFASAYNEGKYYYVLEKKENIKNKVKSFIPKLFNLFKWGKKGYIFVNDSKGVCYYHIDKSKIGKNRWNLKRNGVYVLQKLIKAALTRPKGSYVSYIGYNPFGKPTEKISFILYDKNLDLIIGSGIYLNDLKASIQKIENRKIALLNELKRELFIIFAFSLILMSVVLFFISNFIVKRFKNYNKQITLLEIEKKEKECIDELTGLLNKKCLKKEFELVKNEKVGILVVDINHFKEINELHGPDIGDEVIKIIAQKIKNSLKSTDIVGKGKADEFIILIKYKKKVDIDKIAQRLYDALNESIKLSNNKDYILSVRIGIALNNIDGNDFKDLLNKASLGALNVKENDIKIGYFKKDIDAKIKEYIEIKNELANILKYKKFDQFKIYYQPQIDKNEKLAGVEALIRWDHPIKGLISPGVFLPVAINEGFIKQLDIIVMEKVINQINKWLKKGYNPGIVFCNVTMKTLESKNYLEIFKKKIKNVDIKHFGIEITEESIAERNEHVKDILLEISNLGINISLDDFGTGYSNLIKLKELLLNKLKIDKTFIDGIPENRSNVELTEIIINIGKILNLELVAEGVENEVQKEFVIKKGVDYIQGYYYSKPLPPEEFEKKYFS